mmetsp:Transcript_43304/g.101916  ORF Transcript_43304/g.101916 Transcript_43304/m.101916 type:complete len:188 (-) Transcript_43304:52-615(-)
MLEFTVWIIGEKALVEGPVVMKLIDEALPQPGAASAEPAAPGKELQRHVKVGGEECLVKVATVDLVSLEDVPDEEWDEAAGFVFITAPTKPQSLEGVRDAWEQIVRMKGTNQLPVTFASTEILEGPAGDPINRLASDASAHVFTIGMPDGPTPEEAVNLLLKDIRRHQSPEFGTISTEKRREDCCVL